MIELLMKFIEDKGIVFSAKQQWGHTMSFPENFPTILACFIATKRLVYLGRGRNRAAYRTRSGKYVVKFPLSESGDWNNMDEAYQYQNDESFGKDRLARCREFKIGNHVCLLMEYVTMPSKGEILPSWTDFVDCQQVGYTRKGKLVAYDWAS